MSQQNFVSYDDATSIVTEVASKIAEKQDVLSFDNSPTQNSNNPVKSGGVYTALASKANTSDIGTAAAKNFTTSVTSGSNDLVTSGAVYTAIENLPEPMVFRGSLGTGGTITALPVDGTATKGDTYKVITAGTYASKAAKVGDTFVCLTKTSSANTWELIPSGDEPSGTVTSVTLKATSPIAIDSSSAITTSGTRTLSHANSGATAGSYGDSGNQTPGYGSTFKVPYVTVNATGHVTAISEHTVKIPASDNTNTTYTFANGTNQFTVTPSGGSAQTVKVTPSFTVTTGDSNGQVKVNGTNASVKGLGSAAYTASTAYAAASHTHTINQVTWGPSQNLTTSATANGQEWSIDLTPGSYTGTYFHVWSSKNSKSILCCYPDDNSVTIPNGSLNVSGTIKQNGTAVSLNGHTHNYAGSSSAGGSATSAVKLATARSIALGGDFAGSADFDGSANITISGNLYWCTVNGGNTANYPWHRIAYCSGKSGQYTDTDATFIITSRYDGGGFGVLKVSLRTNGSGGACSTNARWLYRSGWDTASVVITHWGTTGQSVYADIFLKCGQWPRTVVYQIVGDRAWTLVNSREVDNTTASDKKGSTECYASVASAATEIHNKAYTSTKNSVEAGTINYANNAGTVNGKTVAVNVPADAKFTDTKYTASTTSIGSASAGTAIAADDITAWSAGTVPSLTITSTACDDITAWSAGTMTSASYSKGVLTITNGSAPSLSYTARSVGSASGWSAGTAPSLSYTARSIPNISVSSKTVVTGITAG